MPASLAPNLDDELEPTDETSPTCNVRRHRGGGGLRQQLEDDVDALGGRYHTEAGDHAREAEAEAEAPHDFDLDPGCADAVVA